MHVEKRILGTVIAILAMAPIGSVEARDASRPTGQTPTHVIPNPYAAPVQAPRSSGDRATDAYSMGFAIGLGTALINKQREDEAKRQQDAPRR